MILLDGNETKIYKLEGDNFILKDKLNGNLTKRQKKGGQSSVRFSRLAEESRANYITRIVDRINIICKDSANTFIFGARELKNDLLSSSKNLINLKTLNVFNIIEDNFINTYKKELLDIFKQNQNEMTGNDKRVEKLIGLINKNPDIVLFGEDEVNDDNCEYMIGTKDYSDKYKNFILVPPSSKYYKNIIMYHGVVIGKKYYSSSGDEFSYDFS